MYMYVLHVYIEQAIFGGIQSRIRLLFSTFRNPLLDVLSTRLQNISGSSLWLLWSLWSIRTVLFSGVKISSLI